MLSSRSSWTTHLARVIAPLSLVILGTAASYSVSPGGNVYPAGLAVLRSGELIVLDPERGLFHVPAGSDGRDLTEIPFRVSPYRPQDVAAALDGINEIVCVTLASALSGPWPGRLVALSPAGSLRRGWRMPIGTATIAGLTIDNSARVAYVTDARHPQILRVQMDRTDDAVRILATLPATGPLGAITLDSQRHRLLVADLGAASVWDVPIGGGRPHLFAKELGSPSALLVDPVLDRLYVADADNARVVVLSLDPSLQQKRLAFTAAGMQRPLGLGMTSAGIWIADRANGSLYLLAKDGHLLKRVAGLWASSREPTELSIEARQNLDWCFRDQGPVDCIDRYLDHPDCLFNGHRSCLMRAAVELARRSSCAAAVALALTCQCHNANAQRSIQAAGEGAVCEYLKAH
jgi:sugar lactone lactonase YvrE